MTPHWQFLCKQHDTKTTNKRDLETRKDKNGENNMITNRQRNMMIKAKKNCHFEYNLFYKPVSRDNSEKQYIETLKCLEHTHSINLNLFFFKMHETSIVKY